MFAAAATAFPGGGYNAENILKPPAPNRHRAEYASHGKEPRSLELTSGSHTLPYTIAAAAPNYVDRIGDILVQWENKPFWWIGPDGQSKVLVWIPFWGYAMSHR